MVGCLDALHIRGLDAGPDEVAQPPVRANSVRPLQLLDGALAALDRGVAGLGAVAGLGGPGR